MVKKLKLTVSRPSRYLLLTILAVVPLVLLFLWRLSTSPAFLTSGELSAQNSVSLHSIMANPFFAPWRLAEDVILHLDRHSIFLARLPSVILGLIFLGAFYMTLKGWFGRQVAYLATVLLGSTPLYLLLSRSAMPSVLYFLPILLIAVYSMVLKPGVIEKFRLGLAVVILAACLYVPGLIWLVVAGMIFKRRQLLGMLKELDRLTVGSVTLIFLILLSPLILGLAHHPQLLRDLVLIPDNFAHIPVILKGWLWMVSTLFFKAQSSQLFILGQLPLIDAAQIGLVIFGGYVIWSRLRNQSYWLFGLVLLVCLLAASASNYLVLAITLPLLAILIGLGLRYLFVEWMHVFPRNPLPKYFAIGLMAAVVFIHLIYGVRYAIVAWPAHVAAQTVHMLK